MNRNMRIRIQARKAVYKNARKIGAGHKTAQREARRAYMWVTDSGLLLPLSNAPRCDFHPAWKHES